MMTSNVVDRQKRFENATCGRGFFENGRKKLPFSKISGYVLTGLKSVFDNPSLTVIRTPLLLHNTCDFLLSKKTMQLVIHCLHHISVCTR